jgi:hypothetical protein
MAAESLRRARVLIVGDEPLIADKFRPTLADVDFRRFARGLLSIIARILTARTSIVTGLGRISMPGAKYDLLVALSA